LADFVKERKYQEHRNRLDRVLSDLADSINAVASTLRKMEHRVTALERFATESDERKANACNIHFIPF